MSEIQTVLYNPAVASALLEALGITNDQFDDEDLFLIETLAPRPTSDTAQYAIHRIPSLSAKRLQLYSELLKQKRPLNATPADVEAAFHAIPFYNPGPDHVTERDGIRLIPDDQVNVEVGKNQYELPSYCNIMWQPNLAGKMLSRFASTNALYSFFEGKDPGADTLHTRTGYWIDLRNFRSTTQEVERYPLATPSGGGRKIEKRVMHPLQGGTIDPDQMPDYLGEPAFNVADPNIADNVYVVTWRTPAVPQTGEYDIYCLSRTYWTERMPELQLQVNDTSQRNLIKYIVDAQSQVAALSNWEATAIGIANHGLCCVANLSSFRK
ncbi:hypothetical protein [Haliangium ochraceum]|uniref:Uncharacterized protein n=1 Tax=Haliangium ochraceum (strain DSM 14365 / JCM 11303 / SMP-2) TaxID=502025 RepID=D0LNV4_HALO1|nr:hypothetical protein [Haliangium ochraceum]ACY18780.1 hypothetical protein Hoch_6309 [Haliangium ochraceum DSM 14365]